MRQTASTPPPLRDASAKGHPSPQLRPSRRQVRPLLSSQVGDRRLQHLIWPQQRRRRLRSLRLLRQLLLRHRRGSRLAVPTRCLQHRPRRQPKLRCHRAARSQRRSLSRAHPRWARLIREAINRRQQTRGAALDHRARPLARGRPHARRARAAPHWAPRKLRNRSQAGPSRSSPPRASSRCVPGLRSIATRRARWRPARVLS